MFLVNACSLSTGTIGSEIDWMLEHGFVSGQFLQSHWGVPEVRRAERFLTRRCRLRVNSLALVDNSFENGCLSAMMALLGQRDELKELSVSVTAESDLQAVVDAFPPRTLRTLQLGLRFDMCNMNKAILQHLVKIPTKKLTLTFLTDTVQDHTTTLQAFKRGVDELALSIPRIDFKNVIVRDGFQYLLPSLVATVRETNILRNFEVAPFDDMSGYAVAEVFRAMIPLLTLPKSRLKICKIGKIHGFSNLDDPDMVDDFRRALQGNTTLRVLSLSQTFRLESLWTNGIFPALTVNRTLHTLDFGETHDIGVIENFLKLLPAMKGLRKVIAPWHEELEQDWIEALQDNYCLQHVIFPHYQVLSVETMCQRNRNIEAARLFVQGVWKQDEKRRLGLAVTNLETLGEDDSDLTAVYTVFRGTVELFL